ncbi:MAG: FAD-binding protein, partial [Pseudomonadota bacterium]
MKAENKSVPDHLPEVRGKYAFDEPLGKKSWFKCGGNAEVLFKPADVEDLQHFLKNYDGEIHVLGALSNTIIRDGGLSGVAIRLGRDFGKIEIDGEYVRAGALALDANVARHSAEAGIAGLEFFSGIPGSIGGAVKMNAGCYGAETRDVIVEAQAVDRSGKIVRLKPKHPPEQTLKKKDLLEVELLDVPADENYVEMAMGYRHNDIDDGYIVTEALFKGYAEKPDTVLKYIEDIKSKRENSQPIREKTGGSTFANPSSEELAQAGQKEDTKVWQLIDQVGGRGLM